MEGTSSSEGEIVLDGGGGGGGVLGESRSLPEEGRARGKEGRKGRRSQEKEGRRGSATKSGSKSLGRANALFDVARAIMNRALSVCLSMDGWDVDAGIIGSLHCTAGHIYPKNEGTDEGNVLVASGRFGRERNGRESACHIESSSLS